MSGSTTKYAGGRLPGSTRAMAERASFYLLRQSVEFQGRLSIGTELCGSGSYCPNSENRPVTVNVYRHSDHGSGNGPDHERADQIGLNIREDDHG